MRKFALAALASTLVATPALADETTWTGPYLGISAGWNATHSDSQAALGGAWTSEATALQTLVTSNLSTSQTTNNGNIGVHLGYNYQMGGLVVGAELSASAVGGSEIRATNPVVYPGGSPSYVFTNSIDPKSMLAVKARLGATVGAATMIYATGGWAWVDAGHSAGITGSYTGQNGTYQKLGQVSKTHNGFIVGGGIEHKLDSHLSIRAQYDYTDQGDVSYTTAYLPNSLFTAPAFSETITQNLRMHMVRVGVSYNF